MAKRLRLLAFLLLPASLLGGCSPTALSVTPVVPDISQGAPDRELEIAHKTVDEVTVSWLTTGELAITSSGSSSCPLVVVGIVEDIPAQIVLEVAATEDNCTADIALTTSTLPAPSGWETATPLEAEHSENRAIISLQLNEK